MKARVVLGSELAMFAPPTHLYSPKVSSFIGRASESTWVSSLSFTEDTQRGAGFLSLALDTGPHPQVGDTGEAVPLCALGAPALSWQLSEGKKLSRAYHSPHMGLAAICSGPHLPPTCPCCPARSSGTTEDLWKGRRVARGQDYLSTCHPCCA